MLVYHTTDQEVLDFSADGECPNKICTFQGFPASHLCFTTQPLPGMGKYVHQIDIPYEDIREFEYQNIFRMERVSWFAIPTGMVSNWNLQQVLFEDLTGQPWDKWVINLADTEEDRMVITHLLWAANSGTIDLHIKSKERGTFQVEVSLTETFNPHEDYLILERRWLLQDGLRPSGKWRLFLVAGVMPKWGIFGWAWKQWVTDQRVVDSAIAHILSRVPQVLEETEEAQEKVHKNIRAAAWNRAIEEINAALEMEIGPLPSNSLTSVNAMPMRIAQKIGDWTPPIPRPEFEHPQNSGRIQLANNEGIYPSQSILVAEDSI